MIYRHLPLQKKIKNHQETQNTISLKFVYKFGRKTKTNHNIQDHSQHLPSTLPKIPEPSTLLPKNSKDNQQIKKNLKFGQVSTHLLEKTQYRRNTKTSA